ncbi:MAG: class I SAM-dependent DNA methyltransferase [Acidimicrobiales bacterium]
MTAEYREDLAWVHHTAFGDLARQAAATLRRELRSRRGLVVDLACGSGILAGELTRAGYGVLGVDASEAMLRLAAVEAPSARFVQGSLLDVAIPPCLAVTAVGEGFNYADAVLPDLFARIASALEPGGVLLFDVAGPGRMRSTFTVTEDPGGEWLVALRRSEDGGVLTRHITLFRRVGDAYRRSDETHTLRLYRPDEVRQALAAAAFSRVRRLRGYGDYRTGRGWAVFCARSS